jgi:glycosyltransferase involved in cell wall biosynthesis
LTDSPSPLVSVLIPAYDAAGSIAGAIAAAREQTLRDLEIVVVDDASRDATAAIAYRAAAADPRVRVVRRAQNGGASAARNTGIDVARGRWIALLDADDGMEPQRLAQLTALAEARGADLLADNLLVVRDDGTPPAPAFPADRMNDPAPVSAAAFVAADRPGIGFQASGYIKPVMRRAFLAQHALRYAETVRTGEDFALYVQALLRGARLSYAAGALYRYRVRERSLSRTNVDQMQAAVLGLGALLEAEAAACGDRAAARALARRTRQFAAWPDYDEMIRAARERRIIDALRAFARMPARDVAFARIAGAVRRRAGFPA